MKTFNLHAYFFTSSQAERAAHALHQMGYSQTMVLPNSTSQESNDISFENQTAINSLNSREAPVENNYYITPSTYILQVAVPDNGEDAERTVQKIVELGGVL